jgi:hypothetical protein
MLTVMPILRSVVALLTPQDFPERDAGAWLRMEDAPVRPRHSTGKR